MNKKQSQIKDVIVIGAGASGMMAAITAARRGRSVLILEHMDKVGKKILATGNGKCNYTNEYMTAECYHGNQRLLTDIRSQFERDDAIAFFRELGIWPKAKNGYYYPNSGQAWKRCRWNLSSWTLRSGVAVRCRDWQKIMWVLR